jgi:hypothetical protein
VNAPETDRDGLSLAGKAAIAGRAILLFAIVRLRLRSRPLPELIEELGRVDRPTGPRARPVRVGRIVARTLAVGPVRARCLHTSLVLYRLLREQGDAAVLVLGLPQEPRDKDAHAWVEIDGRDIGPPPGRGTHEELARYG